ncbi:hypothetical protein GCM10008171_32770 [Methylopila jiangsuensis]|uniref:Uncharacterized protein n=1 Tax=Methylopila jiangsuensis TaxID=586230 RepID=A0A9W6JM52_9HYPH|nr:hypothetical protein [Methylopila jiangsuensis]MDR6284588.1 hypothetical protein [Methylopila jiangsuensis]GLK78023.1 hypothetical protein GCM10008171_32770 [Methylopila jiangsuensis]
MSNLANVKRRQGHAIAADLRAAIEGRPASIRAVTAADDLLTWMRAEVAAGRTDWLVRQPAKTSSAVREPD